MDVNIQKSGVVNYTADLGVFEAITSTTTGEIATFESNVLDAPCPSVLCTINPVQDLHGQDNPYPAGGGKNLIPSLNPMPTSGTVIREFSTPLSVSYVTVSFKFTGSFANGGAALIVGKDSDNNNAFLVAMGWFKKASDNTTLSANTTYTNELVYFSASVTTPIKSIVYTGYSGFSSGTTLVDAMIETGSTRTAYAPYSNICPITGHTELNLVHTGANVWDEEWEQGAYDDNTGEPISANAIRCTSYIRVFSGKTYRFVDVGTDAYAKRVYYDENKNVVSVTQNAMHNQTTFTIPAGVVYMRFSMAGAYGTTYNNDISINYPSTDTSYHAYTGTTTTTDLGTTVYGGTLDPVSGVCSSDMIMEQMLYSEISSMTLEYDSDRNAVWIRNWHYQNMKKPVRGGIKACCNAYIIDAMDSSIVSTQYRIYFFGVSSVQDFLNSVQALEQGGSGLFICYELETPTTIQLTPQEVKSLLGSNNIYHDGNGEIQVTYFTIRSYSLDGFFENNTDRLSISQTFINSIDFIEI